MGVFLNSGTAAFESALNSKIYVDKTKLISFCNSVLNTEQCYICVSRPRRFGKTMAAGMLQAFYERGADSEWMFEGLNVSKEADWKNHLNKYDVIKIDIADITNDKGDGEEALDYLEDTIKRELDNAYPNVLQVEDNTVISALYRINQETGIRFVVIIDEWDYFFRENNCTADTKERYIKLLRALFKGDRSKRFIALAYITGILPIKQYNSESALNNFWEYTMTSPGPLEEYIGFTDIEVKDLCIKYDMSFDEAMEWYDGYSFDRVRHICGPNSIVNAMLRRKYENYWSKTVAFKSLSTYITMNFDGLRDSIVAMVCGGRERVDISGYENDMNSIHSRDDVLTVLIHLGYLAYDSEKREVYIPNREVWEIFDGNLKNTNWNEVIESVNASEKLLKYTLSGDADAVADIIDECHRKNFSILKYNDENSLAACITLAYYTAKKDYMLVREMPSGYGFADIVFLPKIPGKYPAMVVELKWKQDAETAITQIKRKKYPDVLSDYKGDILLVGISYDKKDNDSGHSCLLNKL